MNLMLLMLWNIGGKKLSKMHIPGPLGVKGRNSDNTLIKEKLGWAPRKPLKDGLKEVYKWISGQVKSRNTARAAL